MNNSIFVDGAVVHYGNSQSWLSLCGTRWLNISNDPVDVTCIECLDILERAFDFENGRIITHYVGNSILESLCNNHHRLFSPITGDIKKVTCRKCLDKLEVQK